jgi:putative transcriptional regulator
MINPKEARLAAGLTQTQAAQMIGATMRAFQEWEGGRRNMPVAKYMLFIMLTQPIANGSPSATDHRCTS